MLRKGGGTFCLLSCVRINKQNRQSLNNISQMLENITEKPPKIILKSFFLQVPGWDFSGQSVYITTYMFYYIIYIIARVTSEISRYGESRVPSRDNCVIPEQYPTSQSQQAHIRTFFNILIFLEKTEIFWCTGKYLEIYRIFWKLQYSLITRKKHI